MNSSASGRPARRRGRARTPLYTLLGMLCLTGCPYTEGCEALPEDSAEPGPIEPVEGGRPSHHYDSGFVPDAPLLDGAAQAGDIDFGVEPDGGPELSTLSCPALRMPQRGVPTVFVDGSARGAEAGTRAAPFHTVAKAFESAGPDGVVWIAAGTYRENLVIPEKALLVLGGFAPGFSARTTACATVLEAANAAKPVLSADATVSSFAMEGLSVRKGARGLEVAGDFGDTATFTIARCVFTENGQTTAVGGALALDNVNARIFQSVFRDNRASKGAALSGSGNVTLTVDQNLFERNLGYSDHGGGLYLSAKSMKVARNTFRANATGVGLAGGWGGAAIVYKSGTQAASADFSFNVFTENVAGIGGALFVDDGANVTMSHDLLYRNRAYPENGMVRGAALYVDGTGLGPSGGSTLVGEYLTVADNLYDNNGAPATSSVGGNVFVEGFSRVSFTNSIFWNNGDRAFYAAPNQNEIKVASSISASQCTSFENQGWITASASTCKVGAGVFLPAAIYFVDEAGDDFHEKSTAGHYANGLWVIDSVTSPAIDRGDPAASVGREAMPNGGRANLGVFAGTKEASKSP